MFITTIRAAYFDMLCPIVKYLPFKRQLVFCVTAFGASSQFNHLSLRRFMQGLLLFAPLLTAPNHSFLAGMPVLDVQFSLVQEVFIDEPVLRIKVPPRNNFLLLFSGSAAFHKASPAPSTTSNCTELNFFPGTSAR